MEYEIKDEPQGEEDRPEAERDGGLEDHHPAQKASEVKPDDYPLEDRKAASLVTPRQQG